MEQPRPFERRAPARHPRGATTSAMRAGVIALCGFLVWLVLDSTVLQHASSVQDPLGARRTAALDVLDPIAAIARWTGLDLPAGWSNVALGRTSDGGFVIPTVPTTLKPVGTTTTTTIERHPTRKHPLRVLLVGDSIGEDLDAALLTDLNNTGVVNVFTHDKVSTGLTRLDYYNWISALEYDVYRDKPDVVIGMMGANDSQSFLSPTMLFGTPQWRARYIRNVGQFFSVGQGQGRKMLWVSVPVIADKGRNAEFQLVRDLQERTAGRHHVFFVNSDRTLAPHGHYAAFLPVSGQITQVRVSDGIHLTPPGAALLAQSVMVALNKDLGLHLHW